MTNLPPAPYMMNVYMYNSLLQAIMTAGVIVSPRGKEIRELTHVRFLVPLNGQIFSYPKVRPVERLMDYAMKEFAWYMSGDRKPDYIQDKAKLWAKIVNPDNTLNSNYGYLVFYHRTPHPTMGNCTMTPFNWAVACLEADKDSRQAVITYNNGGYNFTGNCDYICSQHQSFLIRDNYLECFVALRSSDSIFGLPYNCMWWSLVHQQLFLTLKKTYPDLKLGNISVDIYSSHIYAGHYELVEGMLQVNPEIYEFNLKEVIPLSRSIEEYLELIPTLVEVKKNDGFLDP